MGAKENFVDKQQHYHNTFFGGMVGIIVGIVGVVAEQHTAFKLEAPGAPPVKSVLQRLQSPGHGGHVIENKFLVTMPHFFLL